MRELRRRTLAMLVALLLPTGATLAHDSPGGGGQSRAVPSPASRGLVEAWSALVVSRDGIAEDIGAGRLDRMGEKAALMPELAQAVMQQTGDLSGPKRARVKSGVTQLSKVAEHLHMVSGTGSAEVFRGDLKRIDRALQLIRSQYSEGSLSSAGHAKGHRD